ncbi:MAG: hypothetical protein JNM56_37695 [Planctomycetia bacterium]|nr:hypothetical protein [Planctomycetia bacterium]
MQVRTQRSVVAGAALALGVWLVGAAPSSAQNKDQVLPDADYPKMLQYGVKSVKDALKGASPKEEFVAKARTTAIMIAAYAQQNLEGADAQQRATVRDAALKLAKTIDGKKYAEAIKEADALLTVKEDPKAKKDKIKLIDELKFRELMNQFNHPPEGGYGIHRDFYQYQLGMKGIPPTDLRDPLMFKAYQVAVSGDLINSRTPKKNEKEWAGYSADMKRAGLDLAEAVKAKDGKAGLDAIAKITNSCTNCHKIFGGGPK